MLFSGTMVAIALAFEGLWGYASKNGRLLGQRAAAADVEQITRQHKYGPLMYSAAFALSFVSIGLSVGVCLCLAVYLGLKGWPSRT
ncbi:MAG: hypothetical protein M0018_10520 [Nitrospiraceae bacterium]|nr:hypothetical protein [Nitrospiraceae bacterium]